MPEDHITLLQTATPELPLKFIRVDEIFQRNNNWNYWGWCRANPATKFFSLGYKRMCRFWFSEFFKALPEVEYSWMLRIDLDCELNGEIEDHFKMSGVVHYAAVEYSSANMTHADGVNADTNYEGACVTGMLSAVADFTKTHDLPRVVTWMAPYTNVFFINLHWVRSNKVIRDFMELVDTSGCIFSNRWGDLPLWGATLKLATERLVYLHMPYIHGSHHATVVPPEGVDSATNF